MFKQTSLLAALFIVTQTGYAFQIHHGKVLKETITTSSAKNITLKTKNRTMPHAMVQLKKSMQNESSDGIVLKNTMDEYMEVSADEPVDVDGFVNIYIDNSTDKNQQYQINQTFCVDTSDPIMTCHSKSYTIELEPKGYFESFQKRTYGLTFDHSGTAWVNFITSVTKLDTNTDFATYSSSYIDVQ